MLTQAKECQESSEARKRKDFPLESLEGAWPCQHFDLYIFYLCSKTLPQLLKHTISDRAVCILTTYPHTHDGWLGFRSLWSSDLCSFLSLPPPILCPYFPSSFRPGQDTEPGQEIPVVYSRHRSFHAFTECYILEELKHDPLS